MSELARLSQAENMLEQIATAQDAVDVIDFAEAARVFAERAKLGTSAINHATTIKLRAEIRLADVVDQGQSSGQIATAESGRPKSVRSADTSTLNEIGVQRQRLSEARKIRDAFTSDEILAKAAAATASDRVISRKEIVQAATKGARQAEKAAKVATIAENEPAPLTTVGPFPILYADPPWRYDFAEDKTRQIENHYPTMALIDIKALDVPADDNAVLFLWATSPKLPEALDVMQAWGFTYTTCMVWVKDKFGMGYYARQQHELLLIGKRGALPVPDPEDRPSSIISAPRGLHSAKPDQVYEVIERMYPFLQRCEMFQRRPRNGWAGWGNQADAA
jgi:N6-adenosine-specific RNA methylase IME4